MEDITCSLVIPVYRNEENLPDLIPALSDLATRVNGLEVVFVVDASPDNCEIILRASLQKLSFPAQLLVLSRNFGAFSAIREGLIAARGRYFAVMAADMQEPPELIEKFFDDLTKGSADLCLGVRRSREDPRMSRFLSNIYWRLYRRFVISDVPAGGVDVFGCNEAVRNALLSLDERAGSLIGQLFWVGFRRVKIPYDRRARTKGRSAWVFAKRFRYFLDSVFAFSDLPISLLVAVGAIGGILSIAIATVVMLAWLFGDITVAGYVPIMIAILFFGFMTLLSLGIIGIYVWRISENVRGRPNAIVAKREKNDLPELE
ncbi:glycosyltransferase family 2 protein [Roseomonas hellenica]|uniref:Glycosyltransferase family 2 protein n=1 Tax=Plastoroseomonas hellenica TaxID=2687306 RepID=A0ABS5F1Y2_9PROT|nr:glycosyltransferase family 2 protein [Plastoroseomonas hellenica]MBR0666575.1 glycosyltransferase family 2 protein [Plastoroseomonas hellenica]